MLDVHPPEEPIHGWRDFLLHLFTITIGLLIALSLEGLVEWQHHRHLVHEAEASLHNEIQGNAKDLPATIADLHNEQASLEHDVIVLNYIGKNHKAPKDSSMNISFHIHTFDNVSWTTAQSTGALSYMPYETAEEYSGIYTDQAELYASEQQAARDAVVSLGPFMNSVKNDPDPTGGEEKEIKGKIEVLQGQLLLVDSFMKSLDEQYRKFLAAHPG